MAQIEQRIDAVRDDRTGDTGIGFEFGAGWKSGIVRKASAGLAMRIDEALHRTAVGLLRQRYPGAGGLAAAAYTADGSVLTGVHFQPEWGAGGLCAETGAILDAHLRDARLTAILCVSRLDGDAPVVVVTPCGLCKERLFHWGPAVEVAVPDPADATRWVAKRLDEVQPFYWARGFLPDT